MVRLWLQCSLLAVVACGAVKNNSVDSGVRDAAVVPSVTALSPTSGIVSTVVMITGSDFGGAQGASTVLFGTTPATVTVTFVLPGLTNVTVFSVRLA